MDKHLHKDIGEQFRDEINSLSKQPREHIWGNIDKTLDKTDVKNYKDKFTRLKKRTMLLLLLLIGISTFSVIYFNASKNKNNPQDTVHNSGLTEEKRKEQVNNYETNNHIARKPDAPLINDLTQKQAPADNINIVSGIAINNTEQHLFIPQKFSFKTNGKILAKITSGNMTEEEIVFDNKIETNVENAPEKPAEKNILKASAKPQDAENNLTSIAQLLKKDSLPLIAKKTSSKNNDNRRKNNSRFILTAFGAPEYSAYRLADDEDNTYDDKAGIAKREHSDLSSAVGVLLGYKIGNKIIIQSGIIYSSSNISIAPAKIYAEKDNEGLIKFRYNTSSGYAYLLPSFSTSPAVGDSLFADGANHTLRYISIPIIAKYKMGNKKLTFQPGVGITLNFLTKATLTTDVVDPLNRETEYISKLESIKKIGYSLILTPEVQYQFSKNWSISVMPYFKYSLGAINKGNVVKTYPYTFGLGIGAVYNF